MKIVHSLTPVMAGLVFLSASNCALGDTIFTDNNFNDLASFTQVPGLTSGLTIAASQCASCGNPGAALETTVNFSDSTGGGVFGSLGLIDPSFSYDPSTQGAIASINTSAVRDSTIAAGTIGSLGVGTLILLEQDGNFYIDPIFGPTITSPNTTTGFYTATQTGATAANFFQFDFATDAFDASSHPNFAGDTMLFGLALDPSASGAGAFTVDGITQDLSIQLVAAPEPSPLALTGLSVLLLFAWRTRRRRA